MFTLLTQGLSSKNSSTLITDGLRSKKFEVFLIKLCLQYFSSYNQPRVSLENYFNPVLDGVLYLSPTALLELLETPKIDLLARNTPNISFLTDKNPTISLALSTC